MKIKAIIFSTDGIAEHVIDKFHYRCHHNFKTNFLSFEEPLLFEISNEKFKRNRRVNMMVSKQMKDMFMYEDSFFSKILEGIPKLPVKSRNTSAREIARLLHQADPVNYGQHIGANIYEVKLKGFLLHLAMGFYSSSNKNPNSFAYTSIMLWDKYKPIWIHVNDLGRFVNYLLDHSYFSLVPQTIKGKKMLELKIKWKDKHY